jgi:hypothetical protein
MKRPDRWGVRSTGSGARADPSQGLRGPQPSAGGRRRPVDEASSTSTGPCPPPRAGAPNGGAGNHRLGVHARSTHAASGAAPRQVRRPFPLRGPDPSSASRPRHQPPDDRLGASGPGGAHREDGRRQPGPPGPAGAASDDDGGSGAGPRAPGGRCRREPGEPWPAGSRRVPPPDAGAGSDRPRSRCPRSRCPPIPLPPDPAAPRPRRPPSPPASTPLGLGPRRSGASLGPRRLGGYEPATGVGVCRRKQGPTTVARARPSPDRGEAPSRPSLSRRWLPLVPHARSHESDGRVACRPDWARVGTWLDTVRISQFFPPAARLAFPTCDGSDTSIRALGRLKACVPRISGGGTLPDGPRGRTRAPPARRLGRVSSSAAPIPGREAGHVDPGKVGRRRPPPFTAAPRDRGRAHSCLVAHSTQRIDSGLASSRAGGIGSPHAEQTP